MALRVFKKKQEVAVKYADGQFYKAEVVTYYKDGRVKVYFPEDKETGIYKNRDVFDFADWKAKKDKKAEKAEKIKKPVKDDAPVKDDSSDFDLSGLSETVDNDIDGALGRGDEVFNEEKKEPEVAVFEDENEKAVFEDQSNKASPFEDVGAAEESGTADVLDGLTYDEVVKLVTTNKWHEEYSLGLLSTDGLEIILEKVRANVHKDVLHGGGAVSSASPFDQSEKKGKTSLEASPADGGLLSDQDIGDDWFTYGDHEDNKYSNLSRGPIRFWLERDAKVDLTFITDKSFTFKEHRFRLEGVTFYSACKGGKGRRCILCENQNRATVTKAFYVVDHSEYYSKKHKKQMKDQVRVLPMKSSSFEPLFAHVAKYFEGQADITMKGLQVTVQRSKSSKAPNTGDIWFINDVYNKPFKGEYAKTGKDLAEALKPFSDEVLIDKLPMIENDVFEKTKFDDGNG